MLLLQSDNLLLLCSKFCNHQFVFHCRVFSVKSFAGFFISQSCLQLAVIFEVDFESFLEFVAGGLY